MANLRYALKACMKKKRLLRITTVPLSLVTLLKGQPRFFQENNFEVLTISAAGKEVSQLIQVGVEHKSVWLTRKITPFQDLIAVVQLIIIIKKFKPHIVHTHTPKAGLLGMMASWICRVPVRLHTIAGLTWINDSGLKRWLLKKTEWLTYALAHRVFPNSNNLRQFLLEELRFDPVKTKVIGKGSSNGIDCELFKPEGNLVNQALAIRKKNQVPDGEIIFSFVGRLVRDKGIIELVEAFIELNKSLPCRLLLVGDFEPNLDPLPASTLQALKNNPRIIMAGFQQDVRPWLLASDVFVFPSHREGFPNGVLQACCLELPVIATNINGCNEIIQHGLSGLIVPVKSVESLRAAMMEIMNQPDLGISMGKEGRQFVTTNFSQQFVWGELLKEYNGFWI